MKNKITILTILSSILPLVSCGSSDVITSNINNLRNGFLLSGEVTQTRYAATGYGNDHGYSFSKDTEETNKYNVNVGFQSKGINAYTKTSTQEFDGETYVIEDYLYFADEEGLTYKKELNYQNKIDKNYSINLSSSSFTYNGFYNFFSIIGKEDLIKDEEFKAYDRYQLDITKAGIIANNLLYSLNSGFASKVKEAYLRLSKNKFSEFHIEMEPYYYADTSTGYFYKIYNKAIFNITKQGSYKVDDITPISKKNNNKLEKAFKTINNNFKLTTEINVTEQTTNKVTVSYKDFYFDSKSIYVHNYDDKLKSNPDPLTDYYLSADDNGKLYSYKYDSESKTYNKSVTDEYPSLYQGKYYYEDYLPIISNISSDLFTLDSSDKNLYINEEGTSSCLNKCFYIPLSPYRTADALNFSKYEVKLNDESIDYIKLYFSYLNYDGEIRSGYYKLNFDNIGNTSNPATL